MKNAIPTLEALMERLEKMGMEKYASKIKEAMSGLHIDPLRKPMGKPKEYTFDPSEPFLRKGEPYTKLDPQTGKETPAIHGEPTMTRTEPMVTKDVMVRYLQDAMETSKDPEDKKAIGRLIAKTQRGELGWRAMEAHWLEQPVEMHIPAKQDPVERFLTEALKTSPDADRATVQRLLEERRRKKVPAMAMMRCASALRAKGYDALAARVHKMAAGIWKPGVGVRVKSLSEHIADSKAAGGKDVSLFDEMFDKYARVLEGAAAIVKKAKVESHSPKGLEDVMATVLAADRLMMQKILEIGETTT